MPMERIESRDRAFMATQSVEMRKFWGTFPRKALLRPGAGLSLPHQRANRPALKFNLRTNSMYFGGP